MIDTEGLNDFMSDANTTSNENKSEKTTENKTNVDEKDEKIDDEQINETNNNAIESEPNVNSDNIEPKNENVELSPELKSIFLKYDIPHKESDNNEKNIYHLFVDPTLSNELLNGTEFGNAIETLKRTEDDYFDPNIGSIDSAAFLADTENAANVVLKYPQVYAAYMASEDSNNFLLKPLLSKAVKWERGVRSENGELKTITAARPQDKLKTQSEIPDNVAIEIIRSITGAGRKVIVPLVHTGIVVTIKPPTLSEFTRIKEAIVTSRSELGRQTNGFLFNATSVYIDKDILNLVFSLITSSNAVSSSQEYLMSIIRQLDIPTLILAVLCARYPDGYEFHWSCIQNLDKCNYSVKSLIDLKQLFRVDNSKLTDLQKTMLTKAGVTKSEEDLVKYQEEFKLFSKNRAIVKESEVDGNKIQIILQFRIPSLSEYVGEGSKWIESIQESINTASTQSVNSQREREYIIAERIQMIILEGFLPWVEKVILRNDSANKDYEIGNMEEISVFLKEHSTNTETRISIRDAILKFINDNTKTIIGIPNFQCPNCHGWQTPNNEKLSIIVPIDLYSTFFMILRFMELHLLDK